MSLPAGIATTTITFGTAVTMVSAEDLAMTVTFTPTTSLVWAATGTVLIADSEAIAAVAAQQGTVTLINPDQAGFTDGNGNSVRNFAYKVEAVYKRGTQVLYTAPAKYITWTAGTASPIDLDQMIPVAASSGIIVSIPTVTSVNGQTGDVTVTGGTGTGAGIDDTTTSTTATWSSSKTAATVSHLPAGITGAGRYDQARFLYNATPANLRRARSKLGASRAGGNQMRILCAGTSMTEGLGSALAPDQQSYPAYLTTLLTTRGYPIGGTGIVGIYNNNATPDGRWTFTGTWGTSTQDTYARNSGAGSTATFTTDRAGTIIELVTLKGSGAWTYSIAGAAAVTVPASTGSGPATTTVNTAITAGQTIVITVTSGTVYLCGAQVRNTTGTLVSNAGVGSTKSADWSSQSAYNLGKVTAVDPWTPDLVIFEIGMNDALYQIPTATFQTNITRTLSQWQALGASVILAVAPPPQTTAWSGFQPVTTTLWTSYRQVAYTVADALALPLIDWTDLYGTRAEIIANGLDFDGVHMKRDGYSAMAASLLAALTGT